MVKIQKINKILIFPKPSQSISAQVRWSVSYFRYDIIKVALVYYFDIKIKDAYF